MRSGARRVSTSTTTSRSRTRSALYSVPHPLARCEVDVRITAQTVEIFHKHRRVAAHLRIHGRGGYATEPSHMPAAHRAHAGWTPSGLIAWGRKTGPHTAAFVEQLLKSRPHPEQGYRSCLGSSLTAGPGLP